MKSWKKALLNLSGIITTVATFAIIFLMLYCTGVIRSITIEVIIEFGIMIILTVTTRFSWYMSTENNVRTSESYIKEQDAVASKINIEVVDIQDFDTFIDNENLKNYNTYVSNRCHNLTVQNYKLPKHIKILQWFQKKFKKPVKSKAYYLNLYISKVERKAMKLHKLSAANILTLDSSSDGLIDDRNNVHKYKWSYMITSTIFTALVMFALAMIGFKSKEDIDAKATALKVGMYSFSIITSLIQTILTAYMTVQTEDLRYFKKIDMIINRYICYKEDPIAVVRVNYLKEETDGSTIDNTSKDNVEELQQTDDAGYGPEYATANI